MLKMATISILNIFIIFLVTRGASSNLITPGAINVDLDDKICEVYDVVFTSGARSKVECFVQCTQNDACRGIFYGGVDQCTGCSRTYMGLPGQTGTVFYRKSLKYGETCVSSVECMLPNMFCKSGTCRCQRGYPYLQATGACVETCDTYGDTYEEWDNEKLMDHDLHSELFKFSPNSCFDTCNARVWCRSFDWISFGSSCFYKDVTALTKSLEGSGTATHFTRNCA